VKKRVPRVWWCAVGASLLAGAQGAHVSAVSGLGIVTTIAGNGVSGFSGDGGAATAATLSPGSLTFDAHGNLYVISGADRIRRIDAATGVITTVAGAGGMITVSDGDGGLATAAHVYPAGVAVNSVGDVFLTDGLAALLCNPQGLAFDHHDNLYIADAQNGRVRRIDALTGIISTVAGRGPSALDGDGGPALAAGLGYVFDVAVDAADNLYVADADGSLRSVVRRIGAVTGIISTVADLGQTFSGPVYGLQSLATSVDGSVYFVWGCGVGRILPNGSIDHVASGGCGFGGDGGPALNARFSGTTAGLAVGPQGDLYVSDTGNSRIRKITGGLDHDVPLVGDLDGDGQGDLVVWRPSTGTWYWLTSSSGYTGGGSTAWGSQALGDVPMLADIDGDGKADLIVWRRQTGTWFWVTSGTGYRSDLAGSAQWGSADYGDRPLVGDIDGDGRADLAVWRASTGTFYWLTSSSGYAASAAGSRQFGSGALGDVPFLGDVDGDGRADLIVYRSGTWFWLPSSSGYAYSAARWISTGGAGTPLVADVDGDGKVDFGTWYGSTWSWARSTTAYSSTSMVTFQWGSLALGDIPLAADMDGDRRADAVVWRSSTGTWYWLTVLGFAAQQHWGV